MKVIRKIIEDVVIPVLMLIFLLVVGVPLMIIEDIWHLFFPPKKDPREMTEEEQRFYYGYGERNTHETKTDD